MLESGSVKSYGGALLSSAAESRHAFGGSSAEFRIWNAKEVQHSKFQDQEYQPLYFVAEPHDAWQEMLEFWRLDDPDLYKHCAPLARYLEVFRAARYLGGSSEILCKSSHCKGGAFLVPSLIKRLLPKWCMENSTLDVGAGRDGKRKVDVAPVSKITRTFVAKDFAEAMQFGNRVAEVADSIGHHPNFHIDRFREVRLELFTHSVNGVTEQDLVLAQKLDAITVAYSPKWLASQKMPATAFASSTFSSSSPSDPQRT